MRLITWNINSLRVRLDLLRRVVEEEPDVVCLQEIKVQDSDFMGYPHILRHGTKSYNGGAILSRLPFLAKDPQNWCDKGDSRHGRVVLGGDLDLQHFYVPAGGDLNVAPLETDAWSHKQILKIVSHTPIEVESLTGIKTAGNWVDAVCHFVPEQQAVISGERRLDCSVVAGSSHLGRRGRTPVTRI